MKILVADNVAQAGIDLLQDAGHKVSAHPKLEGDSLREKLDSLAPHVLVVRSTRLSADMMDISPNLELIVRAGAGYDTIDVDGAARRGIYVANCPGKNAVAVAELTLGLLLSLDRQIPDNVSAAREGRWDKKRFAKAGGLKGRTLGIIGMGNIGQAVADRARGFGMEVIAWSPSLTEEEAFVYDVVAKENMLDVAREADAVTLHVASNEHTRHLADREFFETMQPGSFFINTTRSAVVDESALEWAMEERDIRAAVDVLDNEPAQKEGEYDHPLAAHPSLYVTHHIGASTQQAQNATAEEAARVILTFEEEGHVPNCVNLAPEGRGAHQISVRHLDKVGVLAAVLDIIRKAEWNVQQMDNQIFAGGEAACANIRFDGNPDEDTVEAIRAHEDVLAVSVLE